jgi:hypothetical protein
MRRYLLVSLLPGILIVGAQCSMIDKAKSSLPGGSSSGGGVAPGAASTQGGSVAAAAGVPGGGPAAGPHAVPPPDKTKNVLGTHLPPASEVAQIMDEMSEDYPLVWVDTTYENEKVVWSPKVRVVVRLANARKDDILEIQHLEGKKKWGPAQKCEARQEPWDADGTKMLKFDCEPAKESKSKNSGDFSAVLSYIHTAAGKRQDAFSTLKYKVIKYQATPQMKPSEMKFAVDYDFRLGDAWIYPEIKGSNIHPEFLHDPQRPLYPIFHTWLKWEKTEPSEPVMRCYYNGKEVAESSNGGSAGGVGYEPYNAKGESKQIGWAKYEFRFNRMVYAHALDKEARKNYIGPMHIMSDNPGDYTCKITHKGDVLRVLNFTFKGSDVVRSDCEKNLVTFSPTALVKVSEMKGDASFDKDAYKKNGYFSRVPWPAGCPK